LSSGFGTSTSASDGLFGQDKTTVTSAGLFGGSAGRRNVSVILYLKVPCI